MKKHKFIIFLLTANTWAFAQVVIGKTGITKIGGIDAPVSLEFYDGADNARGMLLPWASTVPNNPDASYKGIAAPVDGTLLFDVSDFKVKYRKNGTWLDLTIKNKTDNLPGITNNNLTADLSIQGALLEDKAGSKASIGGQADATDGVLVLTDINKAMILPKVINPQTTIKNPSAGMIVYDTNKRTLCVYNGTVWTFWKP